MHERITLYLADDHQIVIDGLKLLISSEKIFLVVGSANDGTIARSEIIIKKPDIALIDLRMPGLTGLELINSLKKKVETQFVILSMHNDPRYINDAKNYGAAGYLLKNTSSKELMECLNNVMAGEFYFPQLKIAGNTPVNKSIFTPREIEIIRLILNNYTTHAISQKLNLSPYTVETHRKNICRKVDSKTQVGLLNFIHNNRIEL